MLNIFLIAIGLAMDAFAVSLSSGVNFKKLTSSVYFKFGLFFGLFQFIMPIIGYFGATIFSDKIISYSNIVSFILLLVVGGKMFYEAISPHHDHMEKDPNKILDLHNMTMLAIATSIDALAVGIVFAFNDTNIFIGSLVIGIVAFVLSIVGVIIGSKVGDMMESKAEILGGIILIFLAFKFLLFP